MQIPNLLRGKFLKRYKRFFADVELENGEVITAHCPNTGSMKTLLDFEYAWVRFVDDPKRKLKYTLEFLESSSGVRACVNTQRPNYQVEEAIAKGQIAELASYDKLRTEVKYGSRKSRIDILLENESAPNVYVEVKNVTMIGEREGEYKGENIPAIFPDAVTERGLKHLLELAEMVAAGYRGVIFFLVNRTDANSFAPAVEIDPKYAAALKEVVAQGVEVLAYQWEFSEQNGDFELNCLRPLDVKL